MTEYFSQKEGDFVDYATLAITGVFDKGTMEVGVIGARTSWINPWTGTDRLRMANVLDIHASAPEVMRIDTALGAIPNRAAPWLGGLYNAPCELPGLPSFIAEVGSCTAGSRDRSWPGPPICTMDPVEGEQFTVTSQMTIFPTGLPQARSVVANRYRTIHVGRPWGQNLDGSPIWADTVRTALEERYDTPGIKANWRYNYILARDASGRPLGIVDWWAIDGFGNGYQMYGLAVGNCGPIP